MLIDIIGYYIKTGDELFLITNYFRLLRNTNDR